MISEVERIHQQTLVVEGHRDVSGWSATLPGGGYDTYTRTIARH